MRTVVTAAISAALVALAILYFWPKPPSPADPTARLATVERQLANLEARVAAAPLDITVTLTRAGAQCRSETLPEATASRGKQVRWHIVHGDCNLNGREVEIRFVDDNTPLDIRRPKHDRFIKAKVRDTAAFGRYKYALWAVGPGGDFLLEDPELQISEF